MRIKRLIALFLSLSMLFGVFIRSVYKELHADRETGC